MIRLSTLLDASPGARVHGPLFADHFSGFCFDSRIVQPGELFLAVRTAKSDGHDYIEAACRGGAAGVLCQTQVDLASFGATCIVAPDSHQAAWDFAALRIRELAIPVIGITGSAGKTSAKEMIAQVLGASFNVFRNPANYSGWYGLPIAMGGLEDDHELAVLELAVDHFGEMARLVALTGPQVGVVTLVAPAHLEAFGDLAGVAREKGGLIEALPASGLAVLNVDSAPVAAMADRSPARVVRCTTQSGVGAVPGNDAAADLRASDIRVTRDGTQFTFHEANDTIVHIPWLGEQFAGIALLAIAVGRHFGLPLAEIVGRLATLPPVPGRLNPLTGLAGSLILDDSYNASPAAVLAGLAVLAELEASKRVAILGEMAQLGSQAEAGHRLVGRRAAQVADVLITRGKDAAWIADEARSAGLDPGRIVVTYTAEDAIAAARPHLAAGTIVLAKGSAVTRMEQVVAGLMAEPERAASLLVRQDAAWRQIVVLQPERPTWLEVDLGAIAANVRALKRLAGEAALMAVLKGDAYGHGAAQVAHTALHNGAAWCAVACLSEAEVLYRAGIDAPILVLGYTPAWQAREAVGLGVRLAVFDLNTAAAYSQAAAALERPVRVHVKVDTGMHRLGIPPAEVPALIAQLRSLPGLEVEGIFTHLASADELSGPGSSATDEQLAAFDRLLSDLAARGMRPPLAHAANSAALLTRPNARYNMVRPGIALYGLAPSADLALTSPLARPDDSVRSVHSARSADLAPSPSSTLSPSSTPTPPSTSSSAFVPTVDLRPALAWKTQVAQVRGLTAGERVGYGLTWQADGPRQVATIPVGYADGFRRAPRSWQYVLVRGRPAPVVGRVSMDQSAIDVTGIPGVRQGDEVVLIGRQDGAAITAEQVAEWLGTINYEVVSEILARVPRVS